MMTNVVSNDDGDYSENGADNFGNNLENYFNRFEYNFDNNNAFFTTEDHSSNS